MILMFQRASLTFFILENLNLDRGFQHQYQNVKLMPEILSTKTEQNIEWGTFLKMLQTMAATAQTAFLQFVEWGEYRPSPGRSTHQKDKFSTNFQQLHVDYEERDSLLGTVIFCGFNLRNPGRFSW